MRATLPFARTASHVARVLIVLDLDPATDTYLDAATSVKIFWLVAEILLLGKSWPPLSTALAIQWDIGQGMPVLVAPAACASRTQRALLTDGLFASQFSSHASERLAIADQAPGRRPVPLGGSMAFRDRGKSRPPRRCRQITPLFRDHPSAGCPAAAAPAPPPRIVPAESGA